MKWLTVFSLVFVVLNTSCTKEQSSIESIAPISESGQLEPVRIQKALLVKGTATWCGVCPTGYEIAAREKLFYGEGLMSVELHKNDIMAEPIADAMSSVYYGLQNFVGTEYVMQYYIHSTIREVIQEEPTVGVGHHWRYYENHVDIEVKSIFYEESDRTFLVGAYLIQGKIEARDSLYQRDYNDLLEYVDGMTYWKNDAGMIEINGTEQYAIKAGDPYYHYNTMMTSADGMHVWGTVLAQSPEADEEFSQNLTITVPPHAQTDGMKILTVVWEVLDTGEVEYVNGYME